MTQIQIPYKPRKWAKKMHGSLARWKVLVLHRRAGKTTATFNEHQKYATSDKQETARLKFLLGSTLTDDFLKDLLRNRYYGHVLPTYRQAKLVGWDMLKYYAAPIPGIKTNETELRIDYPNGSRIQLFGADNPDALRGMPFSGLSFDEYGQQPPNIFSEVLSKSLADHLGYAIFLGTIKGTNQLYQTYKAAEQDQKWFSLWQDIDYSLLHEDDAATLALRTAMHDDRELVQKGLMTQEEFDQEWYLSTTAAIKGSYYGAYIAAARKEGRITRVPYDPALPVNTNWDLGVDDYTTIWFSQETRGGEVRLIDYYENSGEGLPHYARVLNEKPYTYGEHRAPHDIAVRELGTGKSRREAARQLGIRFITAPRLPVADGIEACRLILPRCYFDEKKCEQGIESLIQYRKIWHEKMLSFGDTPVHDWASHGADGFRTLGLCLQEKKEKKQPEQPPAMPVSDAHNAWLM